MADELKARQQAHSPFMEHVGSATGDSMPAVDSMPVESGKDMSVVGVRFRDSGRVFFYPAPDDEVRTGTWVVSATERGDDVGQVVIAPNQVAMIQLESVASSKLRVLTQSDMELIDARRADSATIASRAEELSRSQDGGHDILAAEYSFDGSMIEVSFSAGDTASVERLQDQLEREFGGRVRMRPVGQSEDTVLIGGLGKSNGAPTDISLENEKYRKVKESLPQPGSLIQTPEGEGMVISLQVHKRLVTVRFVDTLREETFPAEELPGFR
jgi:cell fate regulator YaaT (PSP1 superfamily)